ncbi:unnamed protein product [Brassica napus]|uniref:(rape) hypothetical protein n=1 Tax=Brassica napus TaxID=3708 RepID=A0A816MN53_BRANA|nr:unnamed protein product [Brassica napus]
MSSLLDLESKEVKMVGIWGPSGIGKTTIARALYSRLLRHFHGRIFIDRSFISKSKEVFSKANNDDYNMKLHLQEQFLSKLLGKEGIEVDHLGAVRERLKRRKVLIFIDDLDDKVVLDALVGQNQWFGSWSRIIVVTTDKHLLKSHGIDCIYEVEIPSENRALEMLCRYAFNKNAPDEGFEKLAIECGKVDDALELFKQMPRKNVISWTTMICGYVPDYRSALHDVEDEQKEAILWYHSERLAIAFALVNTVEGNAVTVMKNLRVCEDCHAVIKLISRVVGQSDQYQNLENCDLRPDDEVQSSSFKSFVLR